MNKQCNLIWSKQTISLITSSRDLTGSGEGTLRFSSVTRFGESWSSIVRFLSLELYASSAEYGWRDGANLDFLRAIEPRPEVSGLGLLSEPSLSLS